MGALLKDVKRKGNTKPIRKGICLVVDRSQA